MRGYVRHMFTSIVKCLRVLQGAAKKGMAMAAKNRVTVNLEEGEYKALVEVATKADRSIAWVGRQAIMEFLASQEKKEAPLFATAAPGGLSLGKPKG